MEIARRPVVQDDRRALVGGILEASDRSRVDRGDQRIRHFAFAALERIGEVGEHTVRLEPHLRRGSLRRSRLHAVEQTAGALDGHRVRRFDRANRDAEIVERHTPPDQRLQRRACSRGCRLLTRREEQRVHAAVERQFLLEATKRDEYRAHSSLLGPERELTQVGLAGDRTNRKPERPTQVVFSSLQRLDRHGGRPRHAHQHRASGLDADVLGQCRADQRLAALCGGLPVGHGDAVKTPEALVHAVHRDARHAPPARLIADHAFDDDHRGNRGERSGERAVGAKLVRQRVAEEPRGDDDLVGPAEPMEDEIAKAAAHGLADQERAGEHRHRRRDAQRHRRVGAAVVGERANHQSAGLHVCQFLKCNHESTKTRSLKRFSSSLDEARLTLCGNQCASLFGTTTGHSKEHEGSA